VIKDQIDGLGNIDDPATQDAVQTCIDKCKNLSVSDKLVCIVKCTCTEISSPAY
jgi:hypothetical protein